jgi:predicted phage terminase large subunit-like protein
MDRGLRILELPVSGDKFCRAQPAAAAWNDGRLRIPTQAPWVQDFVGEVTRFTGQGDRHDDQVDALAHLVLMAQNHVSVTADNIPRAINTSLLNRH